MMRQLSFILYWIKERCLPRWSSGARSLEKTRGIKQRFEKGERGLNGSADLTRLLVVGGGSQDTVVSTWAFGRRGVGEVDR